MTPHRGLAHGFFIPFSRYQSITSEDEGSFQAMLLLQLMGFIIKEAVLSGQNLSQFRKTSRDEHGVTSLFNLVRHQ